LTTTGPSQPLGVIETAAHAIDARMAYKHYDATFRARALGLYLEQGTFARAAMTLGIDADTLRAWYHAPEHRPVLQRLQREFAANAATEAGSLALLALDKLRTKLEEGATGARDLAVIHGILCDKRKVWTEAGGREEISPKTSSAGRGEPAQDARPGDGGPPANRGAQEGGRPTGARGGSALISL
jgi:transposase-like protein